MHIKEFPDNSEGDPVGNTYVLARNAIFSFSFVLIRL